MAGSIRDSAFPASAESHPTPFGATCGCLKVSRVRYVIQFSEMHHNGTLIWLTIH